MLIYPRNITEDLCGNKAVHLAEMQCSRAAVPPFVCVPRDVMSGWLAPVADKLAKYSGNRESCGAELRRITSTLPPPAEMTAALKKWSGESFPQGTRFAVRSSALAEDGRQFSFAGQFSTFLNVHAEELALRVADCWRSAFGDAVLEYAAANNVPLPLEMGVVVQQMVDARLSGVVFTANPQGLLSEMVMVVGEGSGAGVAENGPPVTTVYYSRPDGLYYLEKQPDSPDISRELVERLAEHAEQLETQLKAPADIEFALAEEQLQFLQMRPITTLESEKLPVVLDNSNLVESYPGLSLPLTASFAAQVYSGVFHGAARRCLPGKATVEKMEDTLNNMVACVNGRMYYQISNWYTILKHFPMQRRIIPVWQRMMGVRTPEVGGESPTSPWRRLVTYGKILRSAAGIPRKMAALHRDFLQVEEMFTRELPQARDNRALKALFDEISRRLLDVWDITLFNDMYAFLYTGLLQSKLKKAGVTDVAAEANRRIGAGGELASMGPITALARMAASVAEDEALARELAVLETNEAVMNYLAGGSAFAGTLKEYIANYGDRSLEELKLESETWRTSPVLLLQTVLAYARQPEGLARLTQPRAAVQTTGGLAGFYTRHARVGIEGREQSRLDRTKIFGMVRSILLAMGANFAAAGSLETQRDVFYLQLSEVFSAVEKPDIANGFAALVAERKARYQTFARLPGYSRLIFAARPFDKTLQEVQLPPSPLGELRFVGTPCAGGRVRGRVRLVHGPEDARGSAGDILVTRMTDPGWVFLLASAKGVISERGSVLSHTAIIAREMQVPFVVGVHGVMDALQDGMLVEMDGESGEVQVMDNE